MTPNPAILGLDNIGYLAEDRDASYAIFASLGFTLSPLGRQVLFLDGQPPQPWGTGSRCINFARNAYFEIMGIVEPGRPSGFYEAMIGAGMGNGYPKITVRIRSAEAEVARLRAAGRQVATPLRYFRVFAVDDNRPVGTLMDLANYDTGMMGSCAVVATHHFTPEMTFHPSTLLHPNTAISLHSVVVAHPNGAQAMAALAECMDYPADGTTMRLPDGGRIIFAAPDILAHDYPLCAPTGSEPRIIAARIGVVSREAALAYVRESGRPYKEVGEEIHVDIGGRHGVCIIFTPETGA